MRWWLEHPHAAADVAGTFFREELRHTRVLPARRAKDRLLFSLAVRLPDVLDLEDRQDASLDIPQRQLAESLHFAGNRLRDPEGHRNRPHRTTRQPHRGADRLVIFSGEKALQRREAAVRQQLEITLLTPAQGP